MLLMQDFFLQLAFTLSLGVVVYIIAIAVPRIHPNGEEIEGGKKYVPLEKIDKHISLLKNKSLRRLKILILKADNFVSSHLRKGKESDDLFKKE
ncbi:MAG: hypothetical protein V1652_02735 [bacterium]